jgi:hypothetical protein
MQMQMQMRTQIKNLQKYPLQELTLQLLKTSKNQKNTNRIDNQLTSTYSHCFRCKGPSFIQLCVCVRGIFGIIRTHSDTCS